MWSLYIILVVAIASSRSVIALPQNGESVDSNAEVQPVSNTFVDGFVFDGPVNGRTTGREQWTTERTTSRSTETPSTSTSTTSQFDDCLRACPTTPEYNPVCGTDNVNYDNPGQLNCATSCGKRDISINHYGKCSSRLRAG